MIALDSLFCDIEEPSAQPTCRSPGHLLSSNSHISDPRRSIGLDTCLSIQQVLYTGTGDSKYRPSVLLERMVDAQWLGKKNGKGFYEYPSE